MQAPEEVPDHDPTMVVVVVFGIGIGAIDHELC
jgi:hypothetical protein